MYRHIYVPAYLCTGTFMYRHIYVLAPGFPLWRIFSFLRKFLQLQGKKKEMQNKRKYEGNFKKLKKIEKTLILANVTLCNYLCDHK